MPSAHSLSFAKSASAAETPASSSRAPDESHRRGSTRARPAQPTQRFDHYFTHAFLQAGPLVFASLVIAVLAAGFLMRDEGYLSADMGTGYWLGIVGAVIMGLLFLYPLRKRMKILQRAGRVAHWFRLHMIFGILGPTLVILHTNFNLGSLNSRLALFTMLVVVASGIVGRYLYAKVHKGLYGTHAEMRDIAGDLSALKVSLGNKLGGDEAFARELEAYLPTEGQSVPLARGFVSALSSPIRTAASKRRLSQIARHHLKAAPQFAAWSGRQRRQHLKSVNRHLTVYFAAVRKAERLAFFERVFALWHHLHVPLFILLALSVIIHVFAVHRY